MPPKGRRKAPPGNAAAEVPDVYRELLAEAASSSMQSDEDGRSVKRRRVGGRIVQRGNDSHGHASKMHGFDRDEPSPDDLLEDVSTARQQILQSSSEDSANSDVDWENVDLKHEAEDTDAEDRFEEPYKLNVVLDAQRSLRSDRPKKKAVTAVEKKLRLVVHKMNICCLMAHIHIRNHWCNDGDVHSVLRKHLDDKTVSYLNPDESLSQFQRSRSFMDGLQEASDTFRGNFCKMARGMARPQWKDPNSTASTAVPDDVELPVEKQDFVDAARNLSGSRDTGAQLFCSMLRAVGVDARIVCSLQPLQFRAVEKAQPPQRQYAAVIQETNSRQGTPETSVQQIADSQAPIGSRGGQGRFDGDPTKETRDGTSRLPARGRTPKRLIRESKYPIFWIEAFNEAVQKWVPVDPLVTQTVAKPSKFEPPAGEKQNNLSYVVAFEDDGFARDVTRRYTKAYNAKTRRDRVESTKGGGRWWRRVMKIFKRQSLDRDQVEDSELAAKEAAEPMPRNVLDFKDHPYYALERHLRRHEVIHPRREIGKVGTSGKGHNATALEPIYRRRDVQHVQSVDRWFRTGREVKTGEKPLKHVVPMRKREKSLETDEEMLDADRTGTPLYSIHQTTLYRPLPVGGGIIPKNQYGNLDIYVPSMIPPGGAHIQHPAASRAAKILGVDFAEAVTGFKFSGRHGTAITNGAVVATGCVDGVCEIITALEDEKAMIEQERRIAQALAMWRRLMIGLRIRERIEGYDVEGEERNASDVTPREKEADQSNDDAGGGFLPDPDAGPIAEPTNGSHHAYANEVPTTIGPPITSDLPDRPPVHVPVTYGLPLPLTTPSLANNNATYASSPQQDLFSDGDRDDKENESTTTDQHYPAENEDEAIQLAIAQSLASPPSANASVQNTTRARMPHPEPATAEPPSLVNQVQRAGEEDCEQNSPGSSGYADPVSNEDEASGRDDDDDAGSLLSHDPEDEEQDPEWPSEPEEDLS